MSEVLSEFEFGQHTIHFDLGFCGAAFEAKGGRGQSDAPFNECTHVMNEWMGGWVRWGKRREKKKKITFRS